MSISDDTLTEGVHEDTTHRKNTVIEGVHEDTTHR